MDLELDQFKDVYLVIDKANDVFIQRQFVSQGDYKGRSLTVQITNNGSIGEVPGLTLNLNWHNEASGLTDLTAFTILNKENSIFRIEYPEHMMTPGKVYASIQIIQDGKVTNLKQFELIVQKLAGQPVGIAENAEFSALVAVLADSNKFRTDIDSLNANKADKSALESGLLKKVDKNGNEQVTLPMLSQEVKESMTGGSVAVVGNNAVNTSNIANGAVSVDKLSFEPENVLERSEKLDNKVIIGNNPDNTVSLGANQNSTVFKVPFTKSGVIRFPKIQPIGWQAMAGVDKNEKITFRIDWNGLTSFSRYGYTISDDFIEIDLTKVNEVLDDVYLYVSVPKASLGTFNIKGTGTIDLDNFEYLNTEPYKNKPEKNLQELSDSFTNTIISVEKLLNKLLTGYDLTSGVIYLTGDSNYMTVKLEQLPKQGVLKLPQSKTDKYQLFVLLDSKGGFIGNITYNNYSGTWYDNENGMLRIDLAELYRIAPNIHTIYVGYLMSDNDNWYQEAEKIAPFEDVFKWGYSEPYDALTDDNFNLPNYVPLVSGKESYIYFDDLLIGKNLYADPIPVIARNQRDDKVVLTNTSDAVSVINYDGKIVNIPIKSVPENAGSGKNLNVMVIGESTSEDGRYMKALSDNFTEDAVKINFVGTRSSQGVKHEARSGWGAGTLRYVAEANNATNSFINPSTGTFDLDYYFSENPDVVVPDMVLLNFGINPTNIYTTNGTTETQMDHYEFFIKQFKAKNPNVIFIVGLSHSFNRWSNYWNESERDVIMNVTKRTNEQFKARETERIFLNPQYVCLDMRLDFPHSEVPSNQFSDITTNVATNNVHPETSGYKNIALMAYNAIKYALLKTV